MSRVNVWLFTQVHEKTILYVSQNGLVLWLVTGRNAERIKVGLKVQFQTFLGRMTANTLCNTGLFSFTIWYLKLLWHLLRDIPTLSSSDMSHCLSLCHRDMDIPSYQYSSYHQRFCVLQRHTTNHLPFTICTRHRLRRLWCNGRGVATGSAASTTLPLIPVVRNTSSILVYTKLKTCNWC